MQRIAKQFSIAVVTALCATAAWGATIPAGYISWDVIFPGNAGEFDIVNQTGPNSSTFPDTTFPITNTLNFSNFSLIVFFNNSTSETFGSSYFVLAGDGESFNGSAIPIGGTNPIPINATLTGTFSPTSITLNSGGGPVSILSSFTTSFSDSPTLVDGDFGIINATTGTSSVPEPGTGILLAVAMGCLMTTRRVKAMGKLKTIFKINERAMRKSLVLISCLAVSQAAFAQVKENAFTTPSNGVAGVDNVNISGTGFPTGTITPANVTVAIAGTCGGATVAMTTANSVRTIIGSSRRVNFSLPNGLTAGAYFVTVADSAAGDANFTTNTGSCSEVQVITSNPSLNACLAASSLGVLLPASGGGGNVTAYVPKGYWSGATTGIFVQNIEGTIGPAATIATPHVANSCSSNPATGETVCVGNNTDVYLITGTTLNTTLSSSSNTVASFSGGSCNNCGVAVNALNNTAVINMGITGGSSNSGVQVLNLNNNTFSTAFPMHDEVSENISVDPTRSFILSASEAAANYPLLQIQSDGSLKEFDSAVSTGFSFTDSSAEDCSTGIALAPGEGTAKVFLEDLTQAVLTSGSPAGTYTAPHFTFTAVTSYSVSAGYSGSAVAQGSGHLAVVTGEFGGNAFTVLQLPSSSGSGTPSVVDYATALVPSSTACGGPFRAGFDPHTITAYTSPNNGKSYAVFAGYVSGVPACLAVVDMAAVLGATRGGSGLSPHDVSAANLPASAVTFLGL
jgi:hypothetical protein